MQVAASVAAVQQPASPQAQSPHNPSDATQDDDDDKKDDHKAIAPDHIHNPVLWHDPGNIAAEDLFYGSGGEKNQPRAPFTFLGERKHDSNPKFDVRDASRHKWRVKLGAEARPEVAASRLLWAVGYYTDDDYVLPSATIPNLHLHHTAHSVQDGDVVIDALFRRKPHGEKRIAAWAWKRNPFLGTREFNGLRVMMALLNSWDLKTENNAVYSDKKPNKENGQDADQQFFLVTDIGASFGTNSVRIKNVNGKGNADQYARSKFITHITRTTVSFGTPAPASTLLRESGGLLAPLYFRRERYLWIGRDIPRADARWIGSLLGQLSHRQIVDVFRAAHFSNQEIDIFVPILEKRIAQLKAL